MAVEAQPWCWGVAAPQEVAAILARELRQAAPALVCWVAERGESETGRQQHKHAVTMQQGNLKSACSKLTRRSCAARRHHQHNHAGVNHASSPTILITTAFLGSAQASLQASIHSSVSDSEARRVQDAPVEHLSVETNTAAKPNLR